MQLIPINKNAENVSKEKLQKYYNNEMISAEKKNYLTIHDKSIGPYLAVESGTENPCYLLDAASQIATLGLGFNSSVFMGNIHQLPSWINRTDTHEYHCIRDAFDNLMKRKTGWPDTYTTICNSGAEANETALGFCYKNRVNKSANKVLAFEGSFHGRMLISLASTWNKSKREPFQFPGYETEYCHVPALLDDQINHEFPKNWIKIWDNSVKRTFNVPEDLSEDSFINEEIQSLLSVREKLQNGKIFAVIIEPMQCEGGDRYLSNRFHSALLAMAKSFQVPVIHDEVQTGFHLGRQFFWHRDLDLHDDYDNPLYPDYVTCAKKAQVGLVLSHNQEIHEEQFHVASLLRGYHHGLSLDQSSGQIEWLEEESRQKLNLLINKYSEHISFPRIRGLSFAFDINDQDLVNQFINIRFEHGLLYYPAGANTLRFRLNIAFKNEDLNFLFEQLDAICDRIFNGAQRELPTEISTPSRETNDQYFWHKLLLKSKIEPHQNTDHLIEELKEYFKENYNLKLSQVNSKNFNEFKESIQLLEEDTYEPTRQTNIEVFSKTAASRMSACFTLEKDEKLVAIAFASSLADHGKERGIRRDPDFNNPNSIYMIDTTVSREFQGKGIGKKLKFSVALYAANKGANKISGRNRDRLAGPMLNINLALGAIETDYVREDYLDELPFRDVIFYNIPLNWRRESLSLSDGLNSPISFDDLTPVFLENEISAANNKICLSNFVNTEFLDEVKVLFDKQPNLLKHGYTASGQSECVDKVAKSIWFKSDKTKHKMLTFKGHYFGSGSFLSRSLSFDDDVFFPVTHLENPHAISENLVLEKLERELEKNEYLALWLEPVEQQTFKSFKVETLEKIKSLCQKYNTVLIYNETASAKYRFHNDHFFCSNIESITPDVNMTFLGGQSAIVNLSSDYFVSQPLMMISTWDGDEFSLSKYLLEVRTIESNKEQFLKNRKEFEIKLRAKIEDFLIQDFVFENGRGSFKGNIPHSFAKYFHKKNDRYLICPNYSDIKSYINMGELL